MIALLPFVLAAAAPVTVDAETRRPVARMATATVTIIKMERVAAISASDDLSKPDRQISRREAKPLIEFF
jgi:hypothetical protein